MNTELQTTGIFVALALILGIATVVAVPSTPSVETFSDQGEPFYPDWSDVTAAKGLEVYDFDEGTAAVDAFKVVFEDGKWSIPSHHGYPADGEEMLARTASSIIDLKKEKVWSTDPQDHVDLGVVDPLADLEKPIEGRGKRITVRDSQGSVLADYIVGKKVEDKPSMRFVRVPDKKRTYAVTWKAEISTRFTDWIETDLLKLDAHAIQGITINRYEVDERAGRIITGKKTDLEKLAGNWTMKGLAEDEVLNEETLQKMESTLADLAIVGVRPMPNPPSQQALQSKGFFVGRDNRIYANQGEFFVDAKPGITYHIRFGEVLAGTGLAVTAGTEEEEETETGPGPEAPAEENRFVIIQVVPNYDDFLPSGKPDIEEGEELSEEEKKKRTEEAKKKRTDAKKKIDEKVRDLNRRFKKWFYVISDKSYKTLRVDRTDLVKEKKEEKKETPDEKSDDESSDESGDKSGNEEEKNEEPEKPDDGKNESEEQTDDSSK